MSAVPTDVAAAVFAPHYTLHILQATKKTAMYWANCGDFKFWFFMQNRIRVAAENFILFFRIEFILRTHCIRDIVESNQKV